MTVQKELIEITLESLEKGLFGTEQSLQEARRELYEAKVNGWPLEGKQSIVKGFEDRIRELEKQRKEMWNMLKETAKTSI